MSYKLGLGLLQDLVLIVSLGRIGKTQLCTLKKRGDPGPILSSDTSLLIPCVDLHTSLIFNWSKIGENGVN